MAIPHAKTQYYWLVAASIAGLLCPGCKGEEAADAFRSARQGQTEEVHFYSVEDWGERYRFVLFTDIGRPECDESRSRSAIISMPTGKVIMRGARSRRDGLRLDLLCEVRLGARGDVEGHVQVNGERFDLANGNVLVVLTEGRKRPEVVQVDVLPARMPRSQLESRNLLEFAKSDPRLAKGLFGESKKRE